MAFTTTQLDELKDAYARGVTSVKHGDKQVNYASLDDLWAAIQRLERALTPKSRRYSHGVIRFNRGSN